MVAGVAFAALLTWLVRMSTGHATFHHYLTGEAILTVSLIAVPLAFLVGIGGFDYWFYWALGPPDAPRGPLRPRRATPGRTTSASTPTTR